MKFGLIANLNRPQVGTVVSEILAWGKKAGIEILTTPEVGALTAGTVTVPSEKLIESSDLILALGGDGTILQSARMAGASEKPILGINLGGLGFLAELSNENLTGSLEKVKQGDYRVEKRMLLQAEVKSSGQKFFALNDVVVEKGEVGRLVRLSLFGNGEYIGSYSSDGLIFATPTGSTAYSLSVGGPIINPKLSVIIVAPISPHTLVSRSIIFDGQDTLELELGQPRKEALLTIDGQVSTKLKAGERLEIKRAPHTVSLIRIGEKSFYEVLRTKLHWGIVPGENQK